MALINNPKDNPDSKKATDEVEKESSRKKTSPVLVFLLILTLLAGLGAGGYYAYAHWDDLNEQFFSGNSSSSKGSLKEKIASFSGNFIGQDQTITVQGIRPGKNGNSAALLNGEMLSKGSLLNGVRIVEIMSQSVLIEFDGETHRLLVGESFNPEKK